MCIQQSEVFRQTLSIELWSELDVDMDTQCSIQDFWFGGEGVRCVSTKQSRGVRGHRPPENF